MFPKLRAPVSRPTYDAFIRGRCKRRGDVTMTTGSCRGAGTILNIISILIYPADFPSQVEER